MVSTTSSSSSLCHYPFSVLWVILSSFKPQSELFASMTIIPKTWTLENYASSLKAGNFVTYFSNTVFVSVTSPPSRC